MTKLTPERKEYIRGGKCLDSHPDRVYRELINEIDALEADNRQIQNERDVYKAAAIEWMIQYENLKDKYEPTEWVTSQL